MNILKSIGAVVAGFIVVVILSTATDAVLEKLAIFPTAGLFVPWMLVLAFVYRSVYTVFGGYATARCAPGNARLLVTVLGVLGTVAGIAGVVVGWHLSAHWYPIALAVTAFPLVWLGGRWALGKRF